jgi:hypothetical protein
MFGRRRSSDALMKLLGTFGFGTETIVIQIHDAAIDGGKMILARLGKDLSGVQPRTALPSR